MNNKQDIDELNKRAALIRKDIRESQDEESYQSSLNELYLINKKLSYLKTISSSTEEEPIDE